MRQVALSGGGVNRYHVGSVNGVLYAVDVPFQ